MARNKTSGFGVDAELGYSNTHEVQENNTPSTTSLEKQTHEVHEVLPQTQGRKGQKAKRINMAFSDENHKWITMESRRRGISATQYVNDIIAAERLKLSNK